MRVIIAFRSFTSMAALAAALTAAAAPAQITSVPPAEYLGSPIPKAAQAQRQIVTDTSRRMVTLGAPTVAERNSLKAANAEAASGGNTHVRGSATGKGRPLAIGYGRLIPVADRTISGADLAWQPLSDGGRAARIDVSSEGAAAIRVAVAMTATDPDVSVRFAGSASGAQVFGPYPANRIAEHTARDGKFWSPVLEGSTATVEVYLPAGVAPSSVGFTLAGISHLAVAGDGLRKVDPKVLGIGGSDTCEIDIACVSPQTPALVNAGKAVAKILFTQEDGHSYLCSGSLLNDAANSMTPYFYTASHCINSQRAAATLNFYFFFDAVSCGSKVTPPYVLVTDGAMLLGRSEDWDWALVRLNSTPPAGTFLSAWNATPLNQVGAGAIVVHHPSADLKKWSSGAAQGGQTFSDGSTLTKMLYSQGSTEAGSSGAPLLTLNAGGTFYELRGGLYGGDAACANMTGLDYFSRIDNALPLMRQYLTPGVPNPTGVVPAVEFYNATLDHYFLSTNPAEINDLDTGVHVGWVRTGFRFLAYSDPALAPADASPVCRFYRAPAFGDSHFYSADPAECTKTAAAHPVDWVYESPNVFYIQLPNKTTGACPASTTAVYRFFNTMTTNHRYTAEIATRNDMSSDPLIWTAEGYGPGPYFPIMCSPLQ